jgi:hypothetical protein
MGALVFTTWESLWAPLLTEAVHSTVNRARPGKDGMAAVAATIILARTSWEAFINEFIEWRVLPADLKKENFYVGLKRILHILGAEPPVFTLNSGWGHLALLNDLRNQLVHYDAAPRASGVAPHDLIRRLGHCGITVSNDSHGTWEQVVLVRDTGIWACKCVAQSILRLESLPNRARRSLNEVDELVSVILSPLDQTSSTTG